MKKVTKVTKKTMKTILSMFLTLTMLFSTFPLQIFAAQSNEYIDPADSWLSSNNRTNELDVNATTTYETQFCNICDKDTMAVTYRVPEYTKSGETALNRGVQFSDGTCTDGISRGNLDDGTPGVDAYYTGYHWTKSVCQNCGTINTVQGSGSYGYNKNVYALYTCDVGFFMDFDSSTYEPFDEEDHLTTLKKGQYCKFCKGTYARASKKYESHHFEQTVDGQIGNNRFSVVQTCDICDYKTSEYIAAKTVVASYYGMEDGEAHTLTVSDLSDQGVRTSIRYGTSAENCNQTTAPSYVQPGYHTVYYQIEYGYSGETMTENGVSYVWILEENEDGPIIVMPPAHEHEFHYMETVKPSCEEFGYERFQCNGCGELEKRNYIPATGHKYEDVTIREATCKKGGLVLSICSDCGKFYQTTTVTGPHTYQSQHYNPTCKSVGYTEYTCEVCGDSYVNNIEPLISHSYERVIKEPTCLDKGYTTSTCTMCGYNYVDDYTEALGHSWDEGHTVTNSTCDTEGIVEHRCLNDGCDEKMLIATSANGHTAGPDATCTEPQLCEVCDTVLQIPYGHNYAEEVVAPTCTTMGYSIYACECGDTYIGNYTDVIGHDYDAYVTPATCYDIGYTTYVCHCGAIYRVYDSPALGHLESDWIVDAIATIGQDGLKHKECYRCGLIFQYATIPQLNREEYTNEDGYARTGIFTVRVTDSQHNPIPNSLVTIDDNGRFTVRLPEGRYLDYSDPTLVSVTFTDSKRPGDYMLVYIYDCINNYTTGSTGYSGTYSAPENLSNTEDDNGTIGKDKDGEKITYVVRVYDENHVIIPNCTVYAGTSNDVAVVVISVNPSANTPVIVTVHDQYGNPHKNVSVIATGMEDYMEKGRTDSYGVAVLPARNHGYTNSEGHITVDDLTVLVSDELGMVENAYVEHKKDDTISVALPEGKQISYDNRTTVQVIDFEGNPFAGKSITVIDLAEHSDTQVTDEAGKIVVPPLSKDYTDENGIAKVNEYTVHLSDETKSIENAFVELNDGDIHIHLPAGVIFDYSNRITATVTDTEGNPVKGLDVIVTDAPVKAEGASEEPVAKTLAAITDIAGTVVFPPLNEDVTDNGGNSDIESVHPETGGNTEEVKTKYKVLVSDTKGVIENAFVKIEDGKVSVTLPETHTLTTSNQTTVTVTDTEDKAIKGVPVTILDKTTSQSGTTDANGKVTLPVKSSGGGGGGVSYSGGGGGYVSTTVKVTDKDNKTVSVTKSVTSTKATLTLPTGKNLLEDDNFYTVTVTSGSKAKADYTVILKDKKGNEVTGTTDENGVIVLPGKEHKEYIFGYPDGTFRPNGNMTRAEAAAIFARLISEEMKENIKGQASFTDITANDWYSSYVAYLEKYEVIRGYSDNTFRADAPVTRSEFVAMSVRYYELFHKLPEVSITEKYSDVTSGYWAVKYISAAKDNGWLNGYADGTFRGDTEITRAEAVTVINRATGRIPDKEYINENYTKLNRFTDMNDNQAWFFYDIMEACNTHIGASVSDGENWLR